MTTVFLWQADGPEQGARGICGDWRKARRAAAGLLRSGQARTAVVEEVATELGMRTLTSGYYPVGRRWRARVGAGGRVRWDPVPETAWLLAPSAVAAMFRVHPLTPRRWADEGKLTEYRTRGGHRRFSPAEVGALLRGQQDAGVPSR